MGVVGMRWVMGNRMNYRGEVIWVKCFVLFGDDFMVLVHVPSFVRWKWDSADTKRVN